MSITSKISKFFIIASLINIATAYAAQTRVDDQAALLHPEQRKWISQYHSKLLETHDIDYHVATVKSTIDIAREAQKMFSTAGIGSLSQSGRGLLLLIDVEGNKVRLQVSAALEGVYTDAFVSYIQNRQMVPFFAASRVSDGILATTEMIFTRAGEAEKNVNDLAICHQDTQAF